MGGCSLVALMPCGPLEALAQRGQLIDAADPVHLLEVLPRPQSGRGPDPRGAVVGSRDVRVRGASRRDAVRSCAVVRSIASARRRT